MLGFDSLNQTFAGYVPNEDHDLVPFVELEIVCKDTSRLAGDCDECDFLRFCCDPQDLRRLHTGIGRVLDSLPKSIVFVKKAPGNPVEEATPEQPRAAHAMPTVTPRPQTAAERGQARRLAVQQRSTITDILKNVAMQYGLPALEEVLHDILSNGLDAAGSTSITTGPTKATAAGA